MQDGAGHRALPHVTVSAPGGMLHRGGDAHFDAELVGPVCLALADALDLCSHRPNINSPSNSPSVKPMTAVTMQSRTRARTVIMRHDTLAGLSVRRPLPASLAGGAGARPDHSISGHWAHRSLVRNRPTVMRRGLGPLWRAQVKSGGRFSGACLARSNCAHGRHVSSQLSRCRLRRGSMRNLRLRSCATNR